MGVAKSMYAGTLKSESWLRENYDELRRSCREIAGELGCHYASVASALRRFGIKTRPWVRCKETEKHCEFCNASFPVGGYGRPAKRRFCSKQCSGRMRLKETIHNCTWLFDKYVAEGLSAREIGRLVGSTGVPVWKALRYFSIPVRTNGEGRKRLFDRRGRKHIKAQEVIDAYGGSCACCGESESAFLTIDHIGGGGNKHRLFFTRQGKNHVQHIRRELKNAGWPKDKYRLLCLNCNWATRNGCTCPHQLKKEQTP